MPLVKDITWLDVNQTEAAPTQNSDPGTGAYPIIQEFAGYVLLLTGTTTSVFIPMHRVVKIVRTRT